MRSSTSVHERQVLPTKMYQGLRILRVLHCQSREGGVTKFWDEGNQIIQPLSKRGSVRTWDSHMIGIGELKGGREDACYIIPAKRPATRLHVECRSTHLDIIEQAYGNRNCGRHSFEISSVPACSYSNVIEYMYGRYRSPSPASSN